MNVPPAATIGMSLDEVDTPALILDLDAFERNLLRMRDALAGTGVVARPHSKSHKCAVIALQQVAHGAVGVCCQKVGEAEAMVNGGVRDVFVSNQIVARSKIERLAALARQARISVAVDNADNVPLLDEVARAYGVTLEVLVEVKVMPLRTGVAPGERVAAMAQRVAACQGLHFAGLHAYQGMAQHLPTAEKRRQAIAQAVEEVGLSKSLVEQAGLQCPVVTGAGTGTFRYEAASETYTEVQPGSYIFMDVDYASIGGESGPRFSEFEHSLFVWTQIMSTSGPEQAVVDAGLKAFTAEKGMPWVQGLEGVEYTRASDEHGELAIAENGPRLKLGDKLKLIPPHCDPTVNLHDWYVGIRNNRVEALWPITARGAIR